jgi:hypothetical protein
MEDSSVSLTPSASLPVASNALHETLSADSFGFKIEFEFKLLSFV